MPGVPKTMKAIAIREPGGPGVLELQEVETPSPGHGEILIRVEAAGINRPDTFQRMGLYPPPPGAPDTPGLEVAGEVAATGPGVTRWKTGDRVCALVGGAWAIAVSWLDPDLSGVWCRPPRAPRDLGLPKE